MSYTKFVAPLVRANSGSIRKLRISPARCRSTVASTKTREEKEQQQQQKTNGCTVVEAAPVELISQSRKAAQAPLSKTHIDFENTQEAYKSKGNIELLRSLLVFKLCTFDILVDKNKEVSLGLIGPITHPLLTLHTRAFRSAPNRSMNSPRWRAMNVFPLLTGRGENGKGAVNHSGRVTCCFSCPCHVFS